MQKTKLLHLFSSLLLILLLGCGEENKSSTTSVSPTSLSGFLSIEFIGQEFVNIVGSTGGSMSRQPFSTTLDGVSATAQPSGTFSYRKTGNNIGEITFISNAVTFGGLNDDTAIETTVTLNQAQEFITNPLVETQTVSLTFAESPLGSPNIGTFESFKTFVNGQTESSTGTFQFKTVALFNENEINTN